jgi:hypothetical protein
MKVSWDKSGPVELIKEKTTHIPFQEFRICKYGKLVTEVDKKLKNDCRIHTE